MRMHTTLALAALATVSVATSPARAQRCQVISPDGRTIAAGSHGGADEGGLAGGPGASVPFPTLPNWQNTLRRQVGGLKVADMNNDGLQDVIVGCYISNSFPPYDDWHNLIYYNTGHELEANPSWISAEQVHTGDIQIADINRDGFLDILSVNGGTAYSKSMIYYGSATGPDNVADVQLNAPLTTWALSAAIFDVDHDGDLDIITTNQTAITGDNYRPLYLYRNNGGTIETNPSWQTSDSMISNGICVGDYDHDGWEDVAVAKWVNFKSAIYRNVNGTLQTTPIWETTSTSGARGALMGDINGDGWKDMFLGYSPTAQWTNNAGAFAQSWASTIISNPEDATLHDVDGDGDLDLAQIMFSSGQTYIHLNRDGALDAAPSWNYDSSPVGTAVAFGDINGDGRDDLVTGYSGLPSVMVFYRAPPACGADINGNGNVDVADLLAVISNWGATGPDPADVNGDSVVNVADLLAVISNWGPCP